MHSRLLDSVKFAVQYGSSLPRTSALSLDPVLDPLFRREFARIVAALTRHLGPAQLALAEDAAQEALLSALQHWPRGGAPADPSAWLYQVARRKAIDVLRRDRQPAELGSAAESAIATMPPSPEPGEIADDALRLLFLCSHPALPSESRLALTLKLAGGFSVSEIARALLVDESAIAQRIVRAKKLFRERELSLELPVGESLGERLGTVLDVLYLMFNEGYASTDGDALLREDFCREAIRIGSLIAARPEFAAPRVHALLALFWLQAARFPARTTPEGALVRLADQDRGLWDRGMISAGFDAFARAMQGGEESPWHIEAAIASYHASALTWESTDWNAIVALYDRLLQLAPSPVVALNRTVALAERDGPGVALAALDRLLREPALERYYLLPGVRGDLLARLGRVEEARLAFQEARRLVSSRTIQRLLDSRIASLATS